MNTRRLTSLKWKTIYPRILRWPNRLLTVCSSRRKYFWNWVKFRKYSNFSLVIFWSWLQLFMQTVWYCTLLYHAGYVLFLTRLCQSWNASQCGPRNKCASLQHADLMRYAVRFIPYVVDIDIFFKKYSLVLTVHFISSIPNLRDTFFSLH